MEVWWSDLVELVRILLGKPESVIEMSVLLLLLVVTLLFGMLFAGVAFRITNLGIDRRVPALIVGIGVLLCAWVATQKHLVPLAHAAWLRHVLAIGGPVVALLVIVTPVQQAILRSGYVATVLTFVVTLALAGLAVISGNAVLDAVEGGEKESQIIKHRTSDMDKFLGQ